MDFVQIPLKTDHMINNDESERGESSDCPLARCCEGRERERERLRECVWVGGEEENQPVVQVQASNGLTHTRERIFEGRRS